jgi:hypothetical protein
MGSRPPVSRNSAAPGRYGFTDQIIGAALSTGIDNRSNAICQKDLFCASLESILQQARNSWSVHCRALSSRCGWLVDFAAVTYNQINQYCGLTHPSCTLSEDQSVCAREVAGEARR